MKRGQLKRISLVIILILLLALFLLLGLTFLIPVFDLSSLTGFETILPESQGLNFFSKISNLLTGGAITILPVERPAAEKIITQPVVRNCFNQTACVNETIANCENITTTSCTKCPLTEVCSEQCTSSCANEFFNGAEREVCTTDCQTVCINQTVNCTEECVDTVESVCTAEMVESCTVTEVCQETAGSVINESLGKITLPINETTNETTLPGTEANVTVPEIQNATSLTIYTDKKTYTQNETISIFGELTVNGEKTNAQVILKIIFNESEILTSNINIAKGDYSFSLPANFGEKGNYSVRALVDELSAETSFYLALNGTINNNSINIENVDCKRFEEYILWSSGYSNDQKGSINYQTWHPQHNCAELNVSDCFLGNVEIQTRFMSFGESNEQVEGYIQISDSDESICNNPEQGVYSRYLAYETLYGESKKLSRYCGNNKNPNGKCGIGLTNDVNYVKNIAKCYGIKSKATKHLIVDAVAVKYTLCWNKNE